LSTNGDTVNSDRQCESKGAKIEQSPLRSVRAHYKLLIESLDAVPPFCRQGGKPRTQERITTVGNDSQHLFGMGNAPQWFRGI
jgi:hypothetical protein